MDPDLTPVEFNTAMLNDHDLLHGGIADLVIENRASARRWARLVELYRRQPDTEGNFAIVNVTVSLETLAGLREDPGQLSGGTVIPAELARAIATREGATTRPSTPARNARTARVRWWSLTSR